MWILFAHNFFVDSRFPIFKEWPLLSRLIDGFQIDVDKSNPLFHSGGFIEQLSLRGNTEGHSIEILFLLTPYTVHPQDIDPIGDGIARDYSLPFFLGRKGRRSRRQNNLSTF